MSTMFKSLLGASLAVLSLAPVALGQYPGPGPVSGNGIGIHDPTVVKVDGRYLMAGTAPGVSLRTSTDREVWTDAGVAFPNGAPESDPWTDAQPPNENRNLWAPDLSYHNGQYYLYYSASAFETQNSAILLATSATGESGSWEHQGIVIESSDGATPYNAIDPNLIVDEAGNWRMSFGSFWDGIFVIDIDPSTGLRAGTAEVNIANNRDGIEAPVITRHGDFYYLWVSFGRCCRGVDSTYSIHVGRSESIDGPYVDAAGVSMLEGGGTEILSSHGSINGPGHQAVLEDDDATALFYHHYPGQTGQLGINLMEWDSNGWPVVY